MTTQVLKSAVAMVCNMLERDNTPVRHEAAQELRAALATVDASTSPVSIQPVSEQAARFAIDGAITFGRMGVNKPPSDDHWLMPFWLIGGECAKAAQPAQPVAFNAAWDGIDWDVWRMRSIKELVQHLHTLTAPDVRPSEMELRNEIAELKSYLDMVAPEDGFTDAVVLSINQAQRIQETVFILSNMVDSTQPHGESSRQRVAEAAKALCKKQPVPSQPASVQAPVAAQLQEAGQADELASMTSMFRGACADLGRINEALGLDPDDGGADPILDAIEELKAVQAAPSVPELSDDEIVRVLHSLGIDTYPSKYGFSALQVSATSVPYLREVIKAFLTAAPSAPPRDPLQELADQAQALDMGYGPNACPTCGKSVSSVIADSPTTANAGDQEGGGA